MAFTENELKVLRLREGDNNRTVLRIVQWTKGAPRLESREQFKKDGEWRNGKAKGLDKEDIKDIYEHYDEIISLLSNSKKGKVQEDADESEE